MSASETPTESEDVAWASIRTPLSEEQLLDFCQDIERLFRINPFLEFNNWSRLGNNKYRTSGRNISQDPAFNFESELSIDPQKDGLVVSYSAGLKSATHFKIEPDAVGSKLTVTEYYDRLSQEERQQRLHEVDKSLVKWVSDIQLYIMSWRKWSWLVPWRWYMQRIWQPLKPSGRRVLYMLLWISLAEVVLIALGFAIYWIEFT